MVKTMYEIEWWESERGWGQKPFTTQRFETKQEALDEIKAHWAKYPDGPAPDYYIFPSHNSPYLVEGKDEEDELITETNVLIDMQAKLREMGIE